MRISELIAALQETLSEHGDLEVSGGYREYPPGFAGVGAVSVEDHTKHSLAGKKFAVLEENDAPMVTDG